MRYLFFILLLSWLPMSSQVVIDSMTYYDIEQADLPVRITDSIMMVSVAEYDSLNAAVVDCDTEEGEAAFYKARLNEANKEIERRDTIIFYFARQNKYQETEIQHLTTYAGSCESNLEYMQRELTKTRKHEKVAWYSGTGFTVFLLTWLILKD